MLHAGKTIRGGWRRKQVEALGVEWPLQHGWLEGLVGKVVSEEAWAMFLSNGNDDEEWVELEGCYIGKATTKAILLHHDGEKFWVPKSQVQDPEQYSRYDEDQTVLVKEWFARKEGLI